MKHFFSTAWGVTLDTVLVCFPSGSWFAFLSLTEVREVVAIFTGVIACICTVLVSRSRIRANNRANQGVEGTKILAALMVGSLSLMLAGCSSLVPSERQKNQSMEASEALSAQQSLVIRRALETGPQLAQTNTTPMREELTIQTVTDQAAGAHATADGCLAESIPAGVKLALYGLGILILVVALRVGWAHLKQTWVGQGIVVADKVLKGQVDRLWERISVSNDNTEKARLQAEIADLEKQRGKARAGMG